MELRKKLATMGIVYFGIWVVPLALIGAWFWSGVFSFCTGFMAGWRLGKPKEVCENGE